MLIERATTPFSVTISAPSHPPAPNPQLRFAARPSASYNSSFPNDNRKITTINREIML